MDIRGGGEARGEKDVRSPLTVDAPWKRSEEWSQLHGKVKMDLLAGEGTRSSQFEEDRMHGEL